MLLNPYLVLPPAGGGGGTDISDAYVHMDFAGGVYKINGVTKTAAEMVNKTDTISGSGLFIDWNIDQWGDDYQAPLASGAVIAALTTSLLTVILDMVPEEVSNSSMFWIKGTGSKALWTNMSAGVVQGFSALGTASTDGVVISSGVPAIPAMRRIVVSSGSAFLSMSLNGSAVITDPRYPFTDEALVSLKLGGDPQTSFKGYIKRVVVLPHRNDADTVALSAL